MLDQVITGNSVNTDRTPPPASHMGAKAELKALTGLRFVAALYVFLFHIQIRWPFVHRQFLANILNQGAIGMSIFFLLSGFILAYQYTDSNIGFASYFRNRLARIYPVYAVAALVTLPWLAVGGGSAVDTLAHGCLIVLINVFMLQAWFPQLFSLWNDGGSWSISVEMFCSLLLPWAAGMFVKFSRGGVVRLLLAVYALASLPGLVIIAFGEQQAALFYSSPAYRFPEFLLGVGTYFATRHFRINTAAEVFSLFLVTIACVYLGYYGPSFNLYITHDWIVLPAIALAIAVLSQPQRVMGKLTGNRPMLYAGRISYCFYSFQLLLLVLLTSYHDRMVVDFPALADSRVLLAVCFVVLFATSSAAHHLIEQPARLWLKRYRVGGSGWPVFSKSVNDGV